MFITTHNGDRIDLTEHVHQMVRLGQEDFRSAENTAFLFRLGQCISLAAGPSAPHAVLANLQDKLTPELRVHVGHLWAVAAEFPYVDQDGKPTLRPPKAVARRGWTAAALDCTRRRGIMIDSNHPQGQSMTDFFDPATWAMRPRFKLCPIGINGRIYLAVEPPSDAPPVLTEVLLGLELKDDANRDDAMALLDQLTDMIAFVTYPDGEPEWNPAPGRGKRAGITGV